MEGMNWLRLSLKPENIPEFDSRINYISREVDKSVFVPTLTCDTCIDENDITIDNIKSLSLLEPYGQSNPMPSFVLERATLLTARPVGAENRHMKMIFKRTSTILILLHLILTWKV